MAGVKRIRLMTALLLAVLAAASFAVLRRFPESGLVNALRRVSAPSAQPIEAFGRFHFVCLGICIVAAVAVGFLAWRYADERRTDRLVFAFGVAFLLLEWYKQVDYNCVNGGGAYDFTVFPFQFCSLPLYICPVAPLLGRRAKHTLYCFLALFGTVGGYLVMAYPNLPASPILCVHTMLWHTLMILLGVWLLFGTLCGRSFVRDYLPAAGVFLGVFAAATGLNLLLSGPSGGRINLFYMSPYHRTNFLLVRDAQRLWGWGASVAVYLLLFLLAGAFPLWCLAALFGYVRG
ncbi:MAG TPA: hypothetical protein DDW30_08145, partial [Clostridiales bacterium]|nr:hypothetical protein [Clostridiales bacterium]